MSFLQAVKSGFSNYLVPSGRSTRAEFWWFHLLFWGGLVSFCLVASVLGLLFIWLVSDPQISSLSTLKDITSFSDLMSVPHIADLANLEIGIMFTFFSLTIVPYLAVSVRRLHDRNVSGWLLVLWLTPLLVAMLSNVDRFGVLHPNVILMMQRASFLGPIGLLTLFCLKGTQGDNRYGANPFSRSF